MTLFWSCRENIFDSCIIGMIQVVLNLERIRTTLEKETGQVASLRSWAEATGVSEKALQQYLHFGWYCRDELLKSARSLVLFLARNYRGLGVPFSDLLQVFQTRFNLFNCFCSIFFYLFRITI